MSADALDMLLQRRLQRRARASARRYSLVVTAFIVAVLTVDPLHLTWWEIVRVPLVLLVVWLFFVMPLCVRVWARGYTAGVTDSRTVLARVVRDAAGKQDTP